MADDMLAQMIGQLLTYNPGDLPQGTRDKVAHILRERAEHLEAAAELTRLRARLMAGEDGLEDIIELKTAALTKERAEHLELAREFAAANINLPGLVGAATTAVMLAAQNVNVPLPILLEVLGLDLDAIIRHVGVIKDFLSRQQDTKD